MDGYKNIIKLLIIRSKSQSISWKQFKKFSLLSTSIVSSFRYLLISRDKLNCKFFRGKYIYDELSDTKKKMSHLQHH